MIDEVVTTVIGLFIEFEADFGGDGEDDALSGDDLEEDVSPCEEAVEGWGMVDP